MGEIIQNFSMFYKKFLDTLTKITLNYEKIWKFVKKYYENRLEQVLEYHCAKISCTFAFFHFNPLLPTRQKWRVRKFFFATILAQAFFS